MNKLVDERLVPNGEYLHAVNVRMGSTEKSEMGVIENVMGNTPLTSLQYIDGTKLSTSAKCIGSIADGAKETLYWFVHDSNFPVGATGKLDMIVSFNVLTSVLTYHVISIDDGSGVRTTLNFNPKYLITGLSIVDDMRFFTDDYNPPRFFNYKKNYPSPIGNIDQFSAESLLVIKKPPMESPAVQPIFTSGQENFMESRFICFAYRYRYENNEYSATSQFSAPVFLPKPFEFSINSFLNNGMVNNANTAIVTYNTGGSLVKGIDLLFKEANSGVIKVIEKLDKAELGLADNTDYTYTFSNSKIFTVLPESELLRLYDNVPLLAKAQTIMGNRLMYSNYVEGYDMIDKNGRAIKLEYFTDLVSEQVGSTGIPDSTSTGNYSINTPQTIPDSILSIDLTGVSLVQGASISIELTISHQGFSGDTPFPTETTNDVLLNFSFYLPRDYTSVYDMATSIEFQEAVGTASNIQTVTNACTGTTFTDQVNCQLPATLDAFQKFQSGISGAGQPIAIVTSPASNSIGFQIVAMRYVDNISTPTQNVYEYYSVVFAEATYQEISNPRSLHSNRGYEVGIVYMDDFLRSSTALVSPNNTEHVPCGLCASKNSIQVTIPTTQIAPYWATKYKFVIKPDAEGYETIYSSIFFKDPETNNAYFLLEGENARKVEQGDRLIVKADTNGAAQNCIYATVLEKEAKQENFLTIPSALDPSVDIPVPSGVYMKINPSNFSIVNDELSIIAPGRGEWNENDPGDYVLALYDMNRYDTATGAWIDYTVPAGSRIKMYIKFQRLGVGGGDGACERRIYTLEKMLTSSANYDNMKDWWDGDNVEQVLNDGIQDIGGGNCLADNQYISTLAASDTDIPQALCTNYYRFYRYPAVPGSTNNKLVLLVRGTRRCTGVASREKRRSTIFIEFQVFRAESTLIFETEPTDAAPDIFYENELSFEIDQATGEHKGNIQDQNFGTGDPAIIDTGFFNCFTFGNGAESYKIRDSIVGKWFNLGNRVTSTSSQDYKEADRFADITYSGIYNAETNVNKLNEFNLGLLNFKQLERSFGDVYIIDGRETDVLVLQEDKISYVLAGKNLLSDAAAGGAIASIPEVLGTQIARVENFGISFHPESYVQWGYDRFFTDAKRGAIIQLRGNSYSSEELVVVSDFSMRTWFRDMFNSAFSTQKLGGYDPYMNEYVLSSNDIQLPIPSECISCGLSQTFNVTAGIDTSYCVNLGTLVGDVEIVYNVIGAEPSTDFEVFAEYNSITESSGLTHTSGSFTVDKNSNVAETVNIRVEAGADVTLEISVSCPLAEQLTIVSVVVNNNPQSGETIHAEYRYTDGVFVGALQSNFVLMASGATSPIISLYSPVVGYAGSAGFPTPGSTMKIQTNKIAFDSFNFNPSSNKLKYLRSNTLYANTETDISNLLADSTSATPIVTSGNINYADFIVPASGSYLYLVWDLRTATAAPLCYSTVSAFDACCNCGDCEGCATYDVTLGRAEASQYSFVPCGSAEEVMATIEPESTVRLCTNGEPPVIISGLAIVTMIQCGCGCEEPCNEWNIAANPESTLQYYDCGTGELTIVSFKEGSSFTLCAKSFYTPTFTAGNGTVTSTGGCGCTPP
ncbi:MAG: structural protein [Podoviridae sp. ctrTa16]|nr:MAG: structural protein [Podoviridae sp. ctrTa16]